LFGCFLEGWGFFAGSMLLVESENIVMFRYSMYAESGNFVVTCISVKIAIG